MAFTIIRHRFVALDAVGTTKDEIVAIADAASDVPTGATEYMAGSIVYVPGGSVYVAKSDGTFVEQS